MTKAEFNKLKVGDVCTVKRGYDAGRQVAIRYIEGEQIVIACVYGLPLHNSNGRTRLRLTGWHELDVIKEEN